MGSCWSASSPNLKLRAVLENLPMGLMNRKWTLGLLDDILCAEVAGEYDI